MASNYPGSLDSFDTIASDKKTSDAVGGRTHRAMHNDLGDAIESVQTELGTTPSGSESTVAARLDKIEDGTRLGTGSIGATALADNAVDTAAIADGAATPAKLATTGRFLFPTGAANGYGFASGAVHLSGTGAPEGAITAAPGSTFLQTSGAATVTGMLSWRKATGTGDTGWVPEGALADTGWRAVTPGIAMFDVVHRLTMRRRGTTVTVIGRLQSTSGGSPWGAILSLPDGWREVDYTPKGIGNLYDTTVGGYQPFVLSSLESTTLLSAIQPRGGSATVGPNSSIEFEVSWTVDNAWPTSLPGSAA